MTTWILILWLQVNAFGTEVTVIDFRDGIACTQALKAIKQKDKRWRGICIAREYQG